MPYWVHDTDSTPESGEPFEHKEGAVLARTGRKKISFVASETERESWRDREIRRFRDHTYRTLPWLDVQGWPQDYFQNIANGSGRDRTPFYCRTGEQNDYFNRTSDHFAHLSLQSDGMIAYTPDDQHGIEDRQKRIRCGRYLELTAPWLTPEEKDRLCALIRGMCGATFGLARTPEQIRAVYRYATGFTSCMDARDFPQDNDFNPVSVYGDSDLALAYLGDLDADEPRITARCIVWPAKNIATRVYGDVLLGCLLKTAGYTTPWTDADSNTNVLTGAKLRAIEYEDGRWVMPYIDGTRSVILKRNTDGHYFECSDRPDNDSDHRFDAKSTDGFVGDRVATCANCGDTFSPDSSDGSPYCSTCQENEWTCDRCESTGFDRDGDCYSHVNYNGTSISLCGECDSDAQSTCAACDDSFYGDSISRLLRVAATRVDIEERDSMCRDCLRAKLAECTEITPTTADRYLTNTSERWTIECTHGHSNIGRLRLNSYVSSEAFDCPIHLKDLSARLTGVLSEYGDDHDAKFYACPVVFRRLVAADYARNHPELADPQPIELDFGTEAIATPDPVRVSLTHPYSDMPDSALIGLVVRVERLGTEYSVYGDTLTWNCSEGSRHRHTASLSHFHVGDRYQVIRRDVDGATVLQEIR